jgi:hypothetical protein
MADGAAPFPRARRKESGGLPLDPVVESLSAEIGRYLARLEFARQQAAQAGESGDEHPGTRVRGR